MKGDVKDEKTTIKIMGTNIINNVDFYWYIFNSNYFIYAKIIRVGTIIERIIYG